MHPYDADRRSPATADCPCCGWPASAGTGARAVCIHCGHQFQVEPVEVPPSRQIADRACSGQDDHPDGDGPDYLGAVSLTVERIRRWLNAPVTDTERARARAVVDRLCTPGFPA
jgi:hypothetical protein